jgi:hypothetical protein
MFVMLSARRSRILRLWIATLTFEGLAGKEKSKGSPAGR